MTPMSPERLHVPAAHTVTLRRLIAARLLEAPRVFEDLDREVMHAGNEGTLPLRLDGRLCARAEERGLEQGLGYAAGFAARVVEHGVLGYAMMSCATLGDALKLWIRFAPTLVGGFEVRQATGAGGLELTIEDLYPTLPGRTVALDRFVAFTVRLGELLAGVPLSVLALYLPARMLSRFVASGDGIRLPPMAADPAQIRLLVPASASLTAVTSTVIVLGD